MKRDEVTCWSSDETVLLLGFSYFLSVCSLVSSTSLIISVAMLLSLVSLMTSVAKWVTCLFLSSAKV